MNNNNTESQSVDLTPVVTQLQQSNQILNAILATLQVAFPQLTGTASSATGGASINLPTHAVGYITIINPATGGTVLLPYYNP